ncbi:putative RNA-binding Zn ribbon-like protein [Hamadaea flava]|uniref:CGNR zinc finger domain-containing protein n=1 Tax=Hamadaea flava TaxID=1742688 RepID=A0ABV8LU21_9ACTN|nr:ABATE domain-containing protein [Hamadaea flava]MCP2328311.1 putative RNA-binding Zn ribbon-like protein [Hamadaea flava]
MEFNFFGGDLALDLTGTLGRRYGGTPVEFLHTPADLHRWLTAVGIADPSAAVDDQDLADARELREATYRLAYAAMTAYSSHRTVADDTAANASDRAVTADGLAVFDPADRAIVNQAAEVTPPLVRIDDTGALIRTGSVQQSLSLVARAAIALVTGPSAAQLHECEGPACTRMFLDNSARGTRRWCDMSRCGNRAKVAKFRARQTT